MSDSSPVHETPPTWIIIWPILMVLIAIAIAIWAENIGLDIDDSQLRPRPRPLSPLLDRTDRSDENVRGRIVQRGRRVMRVWPEESPTRRPLGGQDDSPIPANQTGRRRRSGRVIPALEDDAEYYPAGGPPDMTLDPPRMVLRSHSQGEHSNGTRNAGEDRRHGHSREKMKSRRKEKEAWWKQS